MPEYNAYEVTCPMHDRTNLYKCIATLEREEIVEVLFLGKREAKVEDVFLPIPIEEFVIVTKVLG